MSLFGNSQAAQPSTSSPFGATLNKPSLFGASTTNTSQPQQTSSLFGGLNASQNQNQNQNQTQSQQQGGSSLFGGNTQQQQQPSQTSSLFGQPQNQNQQNSQQQQQQQQPQQQQQSNAGGLFGASQAQNANPNTSSNSLLQSTSQPFNSLAQSRMQMSINEAQKRR